MTFRAALERLPTSVKDDVIVVSFEFAYALSARDWTMAKDILSGSTSAELYYFNANGTIPGGVLGDLSRVSSRRSPRIISGTKDRFF
jgi:hypothetical protein